MACMGLCPGRRPGHIWWEAPWEVLLPEHSEQRMAQGVNLLFFLPAAVVACLFHSRQGRLQWRVALPAMVAGACAAGLCAWAATALDTELLRKLFGGLLVLTGLWELFGTHRQRKER